MKKQVQKRKDNWEFLQGDCRNAVLEQVIFPLFEETSEFFMYYLGQRDADIQTVGYQVQEVSSSIMDQVKESVVSSKEEEDLLPYYRI